MVETTGHQQTTRFYVEDLRREGKFLRATWHPDRRSFVLSAWDGNVCTASVQLDPAGAAALNAALSRGLVDALEHMPAPAQPESSRWELPRWGRLIRIMRQRLADFASPRHVVEIESQLDLDDVPWRHDDSQTA